MTTSAPQPPQNPPPPGSPRPPRPDPRGPEITEALRDLIAKTGGDPQELSGQIVLEMMQNCLRLVRDRTDLGEVKLMGRSLRELRYALKVFRPYRHVRKISMFGSARTPESHPDFHAALAFAKQISAVGWMVITGAGDGIMWAGHGGAGRESSFGVAIRLPFETNANKIIAGDAKLVTFRYFFTRKVVFVMHSDAFALFPGGFGTHDEGFEVLTLVQTGKAPLVPIVMVDSPGGTYWRHWDSYVREHLLGAGMISAEDLNLYFITDDAPAAVQHVLDFYRNYHSQRFVDDRLVLRIQRPLTPGQLDELNKDFADLVSEGRIEQSGPLEGESEHPELPRLSWLSTRRAYGRLRLLIDRLNHFAGAPAR